MDPRFEFRRSRRRNNEPPTVGTMISAAVVAYGTYRLANWAWRSWYGGGDDITTTFEDQQQQGMYFEAAGDGPRPLASVRRSPMTPRRWRTRRQRMVRCRDEAMKALEGFLPTLRKAIEDKTNTSSETQALKQLRVQRNDDAHHDNEVRTREAERELWETIKIRAVTRMVATAYAHSILFLVVTVQVNLLGGKLFEEQLQNSSSASSMSIDSVASDRMAAYSESHKLVLQHTYKYFFERGIVSLIDAVERAVTTELESWKVSDPSSLNISLEAFDRALNDIRAVEERGRATPRSRRPRSLLRFLMPPSESFDEVVTDDLARWILEETFDLLESPVLMDAQRDCLNGTFERMRDHHWGKIFEEEAADNADVPRHAFSRTCTRPLAHVVTRLKHTSKSFFKTTSHQPSTTPHDEYDLGLASQRFTVNSYCAEMELLPSVLELADVSFN